MKKKVLIGLLIIGMLAQSFSMPVLAAPSDMTTQAESGDEETEISVEVTETPRVQASEEPILTLDIEPTPEQALSSLEPTAEPADEATLEPTAEPVGEATLEPTAEPVDEATLEPTAEPVDEATSEPMADASIVPTEKPIELPTVEELTEEPIEETVETPMTEVCMELSDAYVYQSGAINILAGDEAGSGQNTDGDDRTDASIADIELQTALDWDAINDYIYQQLKAKNTNISVSSFNIPFEGAVGNLVYNVVNEHPDLYFVNVGKTLIWGDNVIVTRIAAVYYDEYDIAAFDTAVEDALSGINSSMTDLQKAIHLHDYLVINCKYNTSSSLTKEAFNAYGAMVKGTAVCQGYALAYKYLLEKAGIASYMVTSDTMDHAWNMVKLDGKYYHVDVTFDDPLADRVGYVRHRNMFLSDAGIAEKSHEDWVVTYKNTKVNYAATSTTYDNAFWMDVISPLIIKGNYIYYINNTERAIKKRSMSTGSETVLYNDFEKWCSVDGKYIWNNVFSGLFLIGERLYFNSPDYIYSIDLNGANGRVETNKLSTTAGYVYGSACFGGSIKYALHSNYTTSGTETLQTATLLNGDGISVSKVVLSQSAVTLGKGKTTTLTAKVYPSYVSGTAVTWTSSNSKVATVQNGVITAVDGGSCNITAAAGGVSASCQVTVRYKLKNPVFSPVAGTIDKGNTVTISVESGATVFYTTDGSKPATTVSGKTKQYTEPIIITKDMTIRAIAVRENADNSDVVTAAYTACTNNLVIDKSSIILTEGETTTLMIKELPTTKTASDVSFSSSNGTVLSVDASGKIIAKYEGTATVTASVKDHQGRTVTAKCTVTVEPPIYTVTFMGKGSTEPIKVEKVKARRSATAPDMTVEKVPVGYYFSSWDKSYTNVQADIVVNAQYRAVNYTIKYVLNGGTNAAGNPSSYNVESADIILQNPTKSGMKFAGWYKNADFTGSPIPLIEGGSTGNLTLYAKWVDIRGLWIRVEGANQDNVVPNQQYTGKAIKPSVEVYYGDKLLKKDTDYTISYQNNKKANRHQTQKELEAKPAIVITGKGNYKGTLKKYFVIEPKSLSDSDIRIDNLAAAYNGGKSVKPIPTVKWDSKKLENKTDFVLSYPDSESNKNAYKQPGTYRVIVKAKSGSNYTGERTITLTITKPKEERLISKVTVDSIPAKTYTGKKISITGDMLKLTYGKKKTPLVPGTDYTVKYDNNYDYTNIGTHQIIIVGQGKYKGERRVSFQIKGTSVKTLQIKMPTLRYNGNAQIPQVNPASVFANGALIDGVDISDKLIILDKEGNPLVEGTHFTLKFSNNKNAGTAKMTLKGMGPYSGTLTKEFTIKKYSLKEGSAGITATFASGSSMQTYQKGETKPKVVVKMGSAVLKEGTDYTLSYANHTSVKVKSGKTPTVTITGKKNFSGSRKLTFSIEKQNLSNVNITAADKVASSKAGNFYSTPVLTDANGKKLVAGTDYKTTYVYTSQGNVLTKKNKPGAGTEIKVTVTGKGNYTGTVSTTYRILKKGRKISDAKVTFTRKFYYTGERIVLSKEDLVVKMGKKTLTADQYEIVGSSYKNNLKTGTAKVTIKGKGEYGGTKTISFTINRQKMSW